MSYKWGLINTFYCMTRSKTGPEIESETKRDAESIALEYVSRQRGNMIGHKTEIYQIKTGRLRAVFYQDSFVGRLVWKSEKMNKTGHDRDLDRFTSETFDRLIDHYHSVFDQETRPVIARTLRSDLGRPPVSIDSDLLESLKTELPAGLVNLHIANNYLEDLVLRDAADAIIDLIEEEYTAAKKEERDARPHTVMVINKETPERREMTFPNLDAAVTFCEDYDANAASLSEILFVEDENGVTVNKY